MFCRLGSVDQDLNYCNGRAATVEQMMSVSVAVAKIDLCTTSVTLLCVGSHNFDSVSRCICVVCVRVRMHTCVRACEPVRKGS